LVKPDDINPVLDVAFDGVHILNGDIVSPQPLITVSLKDENRYLIRRDTVGINLFLMACDTCSSIRLDFAGDNVQWFASADNNFRIEYKPSEKLPDGTYTLLVEGTDVTGNRAGLEPYKISFRVVNQAAVTNFYPYPNPFSTSLRFVFTLTGSDVPDEMRIQIMTITGKVVRTIHKDELGAIRIGDNISEFAWDGKDDFGDQLANGVYLYKVYIRDREQDFEKRQTARDDLFKKNIGKIYLMR
jgi:flagellar hook assembly protein FlgD